MSDIAEFAQKVMGIELTATQLAFIEAWSDERLLTIPRMAGRTTARNVALAYLKEGCQEKEKMTELEKVNGCMGLLIKLCMVETNAAIMTVETKGLTYKDKLLGDYKLTIEKIKPKKGKKK